jgi:hypothetical protein
MDVDAINGIITDFSMETMEDSYNSVNDSDDD